jgi:hypothetical protein
MRPSRSVPTILPEILLRCWTSVAIDMSCSGQCESRAWVKPTFLALAAR